MTLPAKNLPDLSTQRPTYHGFSGRASDFASGESPVDVRVEAGAAVGDFGRIASREDGRGLGRIAFSLECGVGGSASGVLR
mmetsp:Transcript_4134/g.10477  ORF Transcript_4134/g.10477 Transcript_4134/m.10477 type:complete len:81 (-) Transcript_4134:31-273(-)